MEQRVNIKTILIITMLFAFVLTTLSIIPIRATILVPIQYGDAMEAELNRQGVSANRQIVSTFNCQYFYSVNGLGYQVWLAENALFEDATTKGYYCEITYLSLVPFRSWQTSVGDEGTLWQAETKDDI